MIEKLDEANNIYEANEFGTLPREWKVAKLIELAESNADIVGGPFGSNLKVSDYKNSGIPIIRLQNIERNHFFDKEIKYISEEKAKELEYHSFKAGDIILAKIGDPIGKTCIVPSYLNYGIATADVVRIRTTDDIIDKNYLAYVLNSDFCKDVFAREKTGTTRPRVNVSNVRNIKLPLPPMYEQRTIAHILFTIQQAIEATDKVINATQELKKSIMQHLFTYGPVSLEEAENVSLKETEVGMIPEHWELSTINKTCDLRKEIVDPNKIKVERYIGLGHIESNFPKLKKWGSSDDVKSSKSYFYPKDILYGKLRPYLRKAVLADTEGICSTDILVVKVKNYEDVFPEFLINIFHNSSFIQYAIQTTSGTNLPRTSWNAIKKYNFPLPAIAEQKQISNHLSVLIKKELHELYRKESLQTLFNSMLHYLMTGKLRVNDLDLELPEVAEQ